MTSLIQPSTIWVPSNDPDLAALLERQCGLATRAQLITYGVSPSMLRAQVSARRWRQARPGVYATHLGPLPRAAQLWSAVLACGRGAVLSHESAAEVDRLLDQPSSLVHVTVPVDRRVGDKRGVRVHYLRRLPEARHPTRSPPRLRIEETVLGLTDAAPTARDAVGWVLAACQRRLTTPERLAAALATRKKARWREALEAALRDASMGVQSLLEQGYVRRVERAHGLPRGERQAADDVDGRRAWRDVRYREFRTLVELDGQLGHVLGGRLRDLRRDNAATVDGYDTLRFGWYDVADEACEATSQLVVVLQRNGWAGEPLRCGPTCTLLRSAPMIMKDLRRPRDTDPS